MSQNYDNWTRYLQTLHYGNQPIFFLKRYLPFRVLTHHGKNGWIQKGSWFHRMRPYHLPQGDISASSSQENHFLFPKIQLTKLRLFHNRVCPRVHNQTTPFAKVVQTRLKNERSCWPSGLFKKKDPGCVRGRRCPDTSAKVPRARNHSPFVVFVVAVIGELCPPSPLFLLLFS